MVRVRLEEGRFNPVTVVRLVVARAGEAASHPREPPHGFRAAGHPPVNPAQPKAVPFLHVNATWYVREGSAVGTPVDLVAVDDLAGLGYSLALHDTTHLLQINPKSGQVSVAAPPSLHQVGSHIVSVTATGPGGTALEEVTVLVQEAGTPPGGHKNHQDLHVVGGGGAYGTGLGTTDAPAQSTTAIIVATVAVVGAVPIVGILVWCWLKHRKLATAHSKKSAVMYDKEKEAAATVVTQEESGTEAQQGGSIAGLAALWWRRASSNAYEGSFSAGKTKGESEAASPPPDGWEFPRHRLQFMGILGEGCFGQVWKCEATGLKGEPSQLVAVKTLKESAGDRERKDLVTELKVLKSLGPHPNVLSLLACCTEKEPLFIVLEYMIVGKLQSYLRSSRADTPYNNLHGSSSSLTPRDLVLFTHHTARGMEYLARNGIIHRDLATRNVLLGEDKICKVADFGLARDVANNRIYERKSDGRLPIRWMAPESLFDNIFTTKSDVWSFGVLLWEIVTLGSTPYPGMGAAEVMRKVRDGYRMDKPDHCRREIYNIMYYCWDKDASERPCFTELVHTLEGLLMSEVEYVELDRFPDHHYYNFSPEKTDELF
ncbi:Tyrosine kinase receptor Cad96Ca [Chionoecetes opilio]|uniref:receptor protein-tyrosine kinase n=1 Tax=Chionoecetes opilio TaxID=41210 RepID=A0A8J5CHK0_CHIOP|nr:Tyrosine kinase receptor Cad96Ca [Chionoecetes opilio]